MPLAQTLERGTAFIPQLKLWVFCLRFYKKKELDFVLEHNLTGENQSNVNPPNETYSSILVGREVLPGIRIATGFTNLRKDNGDYLSNLRTTFRWTLKDKKYQVEGFIDKGVDNRNIPKGYNVGIIARRNF